MQAISPRDLDLSLLCRAIARARARLRAFGQLLRLLAQAEMIPRIEQHAPPAGYAADDTDTDTYCAGDCATDDDGGGYSEANGGCDDGYEEFTYPDAPEYCDGVDEDCDDDSSMNPGGC